MINSVPGASFMLSATEQPSIHQPSLPIGKHHVVEGASSDVSQGDLIKSDATSIVKNSSESRAQLAQLLAKTMAASGFNAKAIGDLAGLEEHLSTSSLVNQKSIQPNQSPCVSEKMLQLLDELLDIYYSDNLTERERENTLTAIERICKKTKQANELHNLPD